MSTSSHDRVEIARTAHAVDASATAAAADRTVLQQGLAAGVDSFGSGEVDQAFLAAYRGPARRVLENQVQVAAQLEAVADRLRSMGGAYAQVEDEGIRAAGTVSPEAPGAHA